MQIMQFFQAALLDLRLAWRQMVRRPGFSVLVVATLGLSMGAATAVFSLFDAILLRPFPFAEPDRLVRVRTYRAGAAEDLADFSIDDFQDWQRTSSTVSDSAAWFSFANNLTGMGPARAVRMAFTTPELFGLLGVAPDLGRAFTARENVIGGDVRQALIGHALWQELFGSSPDAIGRVIQLRGQSYTVIGVLPIGFDYPNRTEVWVPLMARYATYKDEWWKSRDMRIHSVLARLRPGVSMAQAQTEMDAVAAMQARAYPDTNRDIDIRVIALRDAEVGSLKAYVWLVAGAVGLLLMLGWTNVAGLFIARAAGRGREMALRRALGAQAPQILRQLLIGSLLYAAMSGVAGIVLGQLAIAGVRTLVPVELPAWMQFRIDTRVIAFSLVATLGSAIGFGLTPWLQQRRLDLNEALKQGSKGAGGSSGSQRLRRVLLIAEVAMSVALLVGAGLMLRSFMRLLAVDTGVRTGGLLTAYAGRYLPNVTPEQALVGYADEFRRMREALLALPGVQAVSGGSDLPYADTPERRPIHEIYTRVRTTRDQSYRAPVQGADVMPGYFDALGVRVLEGRDFTEADTLGKQPVVILSRRAADVLFPGQPALGQEIRWGTDPTNNPWTTVVGVVSNTLWNPAEREPGLEMYWPLRQFPGPTLHFLIRMDGEPARQVDAVRRTLQAVNPEFSVRAIEPLATIANHAVWQRRLWGFLFGTFAALAVSVTAIGLFGVMSYLVTQQTREIGIRMAIGASRGTVLRMILTHGLLLTAIGILIGLAAAGAMSRLLGTVLFQISTFDIITFTIAPLVLLIVAAAACAVPAWRASRVNPLAVLRGDS
jgi:predicted permease